MKWKIIGIFVCILFISSIFTSAIHVKTGSIDGENGYSPSFEKKAINYDHEETFINTDETDYFTSSYNLSKYLGHFISTTWECQDMVFISTSVIV